MNEERDGSKGRISFWKLDRLIQGELSEAEAAELREAVSRSPEAQAYLARYSTLESDLSLERIRARIGGAEPSRPWPGRGWQDVRGALQGLGSGRARLALACLLVLGIGTTTWKAQHGGKTAATDPETGEPGFQAKGGGSAVFRLTLRGTEYQPGQVAPARTGDTLAIAYRSSGAVRAQIWYREEGGAPHPMAADTALLSWPAATSWRQAPGLILLDKEWKRQTVWVVWSHTPFSTADAKDALEGRMRRTGPRAETFRLAAPE